MSLYISNPFHTFSSLFKSPNTSSLIHPLNWWYCFLFYWGNKKPSDKTICRLLSPHLLIHTLLFLSVVMDQLVMLPAKVSLSMCVLDPIPFAYSHTLQETSDNVLSLFVFLTWFLTSSQKHIVIVISPGLKISLSWTLKTILKKEKKTARVLSLLWLAFHSLFNPTHWKHISRGYQWSPYCRTLRSILRTHPVNGSHGHGRSLLLKARNSLPLGTPCILLLFRASVGGTQGSVLRPLLYFHLFPGL